MLSHRNTPYPTMLKNRPNAIIMGGSLGGLNAAFFLRDAGFAVTVLERSRTPLAGQGAGIVLNPYTVRYLLDIPALDIADISIRSQLLRYIDQSGQIVAERPSPLRFASYNSIYAGLQTLLGTQNYHLNQRVTGFDQRGDCVRVHTAQGLQMTCDLLVCADGIGSDARRWLLGNTTAQYAGYIAWRGLISAADVPADTFDLLQDSIVYHITPNGHLLTYPIPVVEDSLADRERYVNWLWYRNVAAGADFANIMTDQNGVQRALSVPSGAVRADAIAQLKADATTLPDILSELITQTDQPFIQAVFDYEIPQMAFGRICILGDAAFSARPHTAAGTAKAAEDARQLGLALHDCADIPTALKLWEAKQLSLGASLVERNRVAGTMLQNGTWPIGAPLAFGLYEQGDSQMT